MFEIRVYLRNQPPVELLLSESDYRALQINKSYSSLFLRADRSQVRIWNHDITGVEVLRDTQSFIEEIANEIVG